MPVIAIAAFAGVGALVPTLMFVAARARPIDIGLAALGYGGFVATVAAMGPYYSAGPYLFVPLAVVFTAAWVAATVRTVQRRRPR